MSDIDRIIATGDRADLKKWLKSASNQEIKDKWIKLACCKVQDFSQLIYNEMYNREMIK